MKNTFMEYIIDDDVTEYVSEEFRVVHNERTSHSSIYVMNNEWNYHFSMDGIPVANVLIMLETCRPGLQAVDMPTDVKAASLITQSGNVNARTQVLGQFTDNSSDNAASYTAAILSVPIDDCTMLRSSAVPDIEESDEWPFEEDDETSFGPCTGNCFNCDMECDERKGGRSNARFD
jgi:hypothetical protein